MSSKNFADAAVMATEYRLEIRPEIRQQLRRDIESLVGYFDDGKFRLPEQIRLLMGLEQYVVLVRGEEIHRFPVASARQEAESLRSKLISSMTVMLPPELYARVYCGPQGRPTEKDVTIEVQPIE
jgi:hypothetical protein